LWFTNSFGPACCHGQGSIGRITTSGTVSTFTAPGIKHPEGITTGPDGALWFTNDGNDTSSIGRITTTGRISIFPGDPSWTGSITAGPDGALWFDNSNNELGRITTSGTVSTYSAPSVWAEDITTGPDGALWFINLTDAIGRVTVPAPVPASFSPTSGAVGTSVTVTGNSLEDAGSVAIDGVEAVVTKDSATRIKFNVPSGANSGRIEVTTPSGIGISATKFKVVN
jgi:virginiamycin B lyase